MVGENVVELNSECASCNEKTDNREGEHDLIDGFRENSSFGEIFEEVRWLMVLLHEEETSANHTVQIGKVF